MFQPICAYTSGFIYTKLILLLSVCYLDKHCVNLWVHKLMASNKTIAEMKIRNDFMFRLVAAAQEGNLQAPFNQFPPSAPLKSLVYLLKGSPAAVIAKEGKKDSTAWECELPDEEVSKPMLFRKSPDGGAFLAEQPIPKYGAFVYMAVVSKPQTNDDNPPKN